MRKRLPLCPFVVCCCNIKSSCKNRVQKVIPDRRRFCWFRQKTLLCWRLSRLFEFPKRKWCKEWHFYCHHVLPGKKKIWNRNHFKYFHVKTIFRFFRSFAIFLVKLERRPNILEWIHLQIQIPRIYFPHDFCGKTEGFVIKMKIVPIV